MRLFAVPALLLLTTAAAAHAADAPMRLRVQTICVGERCDAVTRYAAQIGPAITPAASPGALLPTEPDPLAPCLADDTTKKVASCVQQTLDKLSPDTRAALDAQQLDGYLVLVMKQEHDDSVQGLAIVVTRSGNVVSSWLAISALTPGGEGSIIAGTAPADAPFIVIMPGLADSAARSGLNGLPPHYAVQRFSSPAMSGVHYGSLLIIPKRAE